MSATTNTGATCPFQEQQTYNQVNNRTWWPNNLNLNPLARGDPTAALKGYAEEFATLNLDEVKADIVKVMKTSQKWWPADYGHYGPFFIRLAWHSAGTYRTFDGRGGGGTGNIRYAPLNSWPDNGNLDKAKRLLWPVKKKYGRKLSWGDLIIYAGNCAIEDMGLKPFGFAGGRVDIWEPEEDIYWGPESEWLAANRGGLGDNLGQPLGAVQMGLIYVNPQGPGGNPDVIASAQDIRETFGRMAMNDEETVALIAGGHTFGKAHGAADADKYVGPEPEGAPIEEQGFGWTSSYESGGGLHAITSGLEGAWTAEPTKWDNGYFDNLFGYEWEKTTSPAGAIQWVPTDASTANMVPDAHDPNTRHKPVMFTTDLAMRYDPSYGIISKRFHENPELFADAFGRAWYKLTHRDMGPIARCLGNQVAPEQIWQDPVPLVSHQLINEADAAELKRMIMQHSGCSVSELVKVAWGSASTYRCTDYRGGANGARIRLAPQNSWAANDPAELTKVLGALSNIQSAYSKKVSMADLIVLAGCAAIESAASAGGYNVTVPFTPGRTDASAEQTDAASFSVLEPHFDGFRNHHSSSGTGASAEAMLVDKAHMLNLTKSEMAALVGGMRVLGANSGNSKLGVFTSTPGVLSNDFFVNLLDMDTKWVPSSDGSTFNGVDRESGASKWQGSRVDLIFGSNSQLRSLAEHYACDDSKPYFVRDFVNAWAKVMSNDRFDLKSSGMARL
jgi:catalase-peroxidase